MQQISWARVCAGRLARQGLAVPSKGRSPAEVVRSMAGTHAQVMSAAEWSIGLRDSTIMRADVRASLWDEHSLIKTYGPRGTVHVLPAEDYPLWIGALRAAPEVVNNRRPKAAPPPPAHRDASRRHSHSKHVRMTAEQTTAVLDAIGDALEAAEQTVDELSDEVVARTGSWAGDLVMEAFQGKWPRWRQSMHLAGMRGVLCFGPGRGRKVTYTNPRRFLPGFEPADAEKSLAWLAKGFLRAYGPATPKQFAHWLSAPPAWAAEWFDSLDLVEVEVEGERAFAAAAEDVAADPDELPEGVRLLPYFDGYAYAVGNRRDVLYPGRAFERAKGNFQVVLVDGLVGGVWHQKRSGRRLDVTVEPLVRLTKRRRAQLDEQVGRLGEFLEAQPRLTIGTVTVGGHA